jgi:hypothetical protein
MSKSKKPSVYVSKFLRDAALARLDDAAALMKYPILMDCLMPVYEKNTLTRQAGKLTISPEGAHWRVKLDCPTECLSLVFVAESLVELLEGLEAKLASGTAVWSPGWKKNKAKLPTIDEAIQ